MTITAFRSIACLLALALLVSCGDDSTAPPPEETNVTLESGNAASETIGVEGGTLTTTANDGTVYTLEIPEGSISESHTVTMTPVVDIDGYPVADGIAAGVDLKPAGLVFAVPATLTIETAKTPGTGLAPIAVNYEGDASSFAPGFVGTGVGTFTIPIEHFSGWTVGFATPQELETIAELEGLMCLGPVLPMVFPADMAAAIAVYRTCFTSDVLPAINQAATDRALAEAIGKYNMWKTVSRFVINMPAFDDAAETQQAMDALVPKLQQAITANNDQCRQTESFASAAKVLFWQRQAAHFGIDTVAHLLDLETVVRDLCLRPVVDNVQIPANLQIGFPHSLDIEFGVLFGGQTASQGAPFSVQIQGSGVTVQHPTGFTNSQGQYTTVVTATQAGPISLTATACLVFPGTTLPTPVCVDKAIAGTGIGGPVGVDMTGRWHMGFVSFDVPSPCGGFGGGAVAEITQNQNAITGTWESTVMCGIATMSGTLSGTLANASDGLGNEWVELQNWTISVTSASGGCMIFIHEIDAVEPGVLEFQNTRVRNTNGEAHPINGCAESNTFIMFMDRCTPQTCPPATALRD